jgi:hypothetical protein
MNIKILRARLLEQINHLPDDAVEQIADFAMFVMIKRRIEPLYEDWDDQLWQDFALSQLFAEDDDVEYSLEDAREIYHP